MPDVEAALSLPSGSGPAPEPSGLPALSPLSRKRTAGADLGNSGAGSPHLVHRPLTPAPVPDAPALALVVAFAGQCFGGCHRQRRLHAEPSIGAGEDAHVPAPYHSPVRSVCSIPIPIARPAAPPSKPL